MIDYPLLAHGITHLTDARYFAAWHPAYLCFPLGEGGLSLDYFAAIREWVEGPVCVAELSAPESVGTGANFPAEELSKRGVTHVLLDYGYPASSYSAQNITVLTRLPVAGYQSAIDVAERLLETPGTVLLDFTEGGITYGDLVDGHPFSIGILKEMIGERQVFVRIDLSPDEVTEAKEMVYGLAFRGSSEEKVGYKSFDDLDDIFEALE